MVIECVAVVGAGTMGSGIAQVMASAGLAVSLTDTVPEQRARGLERIRRATLRLVDKGELTAAAQAAVMARVSVVDDLMALSDAQLVVEAIVEHLPAKEQLLRELDALLPPESILASNTSSISITRLGAATGRPDRVIGMHFINPAPVMRLVEVIRGLATSDETAATVLDLAQRLGKVAVTVQDVPGFVLNRLLIPMINEAVYLLQDGAAIREDIDTVMKLGANHPMGPLALADLVGLDTCLAIMEVLHRDLGEDKYRPCPLLRTMVAAGHLGRKVGRGFYVYP
jgi:3-hydroxybutyryl-CoA dehydrogenase